MADPTTAELKYRECRDALKSGKLIVISDGPRREFIQSVRTEGTHRDGGKTFIADTLSGPIKFNAATFTIFDNPRDAQHCLFGGALN